MKIGVLPALGNRFPTPHEVASLEARLDAVASEIIVPAGRL